VTARIPADAAERERALDPGRSFIVQAPAGAGKTALLIQRYLRLLATVTEPEEILAMTFTRKAAAEMKRRVLEALDTGGAPLNAHADENDRRTHALAVEALKRDAECGWRLRENTARLRVRTIDSFNVSLTRQLPVMARLGWQPGLVDDAGELFQEAAVRTLSLIDSDKRYDEAIASLLVRLDGNQHVAAKLLAGMLARRDQWLGRDQRLELDRLSVERAYQSERRALIGQALSLFPPGQVPELLSLIDSAAGHLRRMGIASRILLAEGRRALPPADEPSAPAWLGIATLLLVKTGEKWRERITKAEGFPQVKEGGTKGAKERLESLIGHLSGVPSLREALSDVLLMPPGDVSDDHWLAMEAAARVLPVAAAQLRLVFAERGRVDHAEIAGAAVHALGATDEPSDLLLRLDARIAHILVDEFQDTSHGQWRLLELLTAGWAPGDGRTVFAVGDPMQSIYRFREAEVGLFLRAWNDGLPNVRLEPVRLTTNFRSQEALVAWVNESFPSILPAKDNPTEGAVSFAASTAHHPPLAGEAVQWHAFVDADDDRARHDEAAAVVRLIRAAHGGDPGAKVAVLVRNRSHLDRIAPALREAGLRYRALDIEPLATRQPVIDLVALTRALSHLGDRLSWLAVLRAPWSGLTLADLHALVNDDDRTVIELLADPARVSRLTAGGQATLADVAPVLFSAVDNRLRGSLREAIENAWLALGGPACLPAAVDREDAEAFFDCLDDIAEGDDLPDVARLEEHLASRYGAPDLSAPEALQVMTIHKAKGLQFDVVIVPGLDRRPRGDEAPLLRWKVRAGGELLVAPVKASDDAADPYTDYLKKLEQRAEGHEAERLLYVAATRAKHRLHLLGRVGVEEPSAGNACARRPSATSLLGKAWTVAEPAFRDAPVRSKGPVAAAASSPAANIRLGPVAPLRRLNPGVRRVTVSAPTAAWRLDVEAIRAPVEFSWASESARLVGVVAHRWLQRMAEEGLSAWSESRVRGLAPRIAAELERRGVPEVERSPAVVSVLDSLAGALSDARGRWILGSHAHASNELRIQYIDGKRLRTAVMDRVFTTDSGERWVVDYKTGRHEGGGEEAFLDRERERYAEQLRRYARVLGDGRRLGLFFPLVPGWREVE